MRPNIRFYAVLVAGILTPVVAWFYAGAADPVSKAEAKLPQAVRQLLQEKKYDDVLAEIEKLQAGSEVPKDYLAYLKGRVYHLNKNFDKAISQFESVEKDYAESPFAKRSKLARAVSLARKGDFQAAEELYREQATRLLSMERKQEIADILMEFANVYLKPVDPHVPPDYVKALEFLNQVLVVGPQPEKKIEVELLVGQCYQETGNLQEAANRFAQFIKDHPGSKLDIEARARLSECQLGMGQLVEARRTLEDLLAEHKDASSERIPEARFRIAQTYQMPTPQDDNELSLGISALETYLSSHPDHKQASTAHMWIARGYMFRGRNEQAVTTIKKFLGEDRYSKSEEFPSAMVLLGEAYQYQKKFEDAIAVWTEYLGKYPSHGSWSDVQRAIINSEYLRAEDARDEKKYDAAKKLWVDFQAKYPLDARNPAILFELGNMELLQDRYKEAVDEWRRLVSKYPGSEEASHGQFMIGATLEEKLHQLEDALKEYQKVTWGSYVGPAQANIARLMAKSLTIATERVFRTNETPKIRITSRNIESVQVRGYSVDLETYFRKMHLMGMIESLDIALIDPDQSFEFKIPNYVPYQETSFEVDVPQSDLAGGENPAGNVMAVTVSGPTLEATTLLLRSDLDIVAKSSRNEVFVFAENMRTGKPWENVKLLISDGQKVFAEAATGKDGIFQQTYEELKSIADLRVFAIAEKNVASNFVSLAGVGVAQGLTDKGYIYTDRPAYQAGQVVHVRGLIRRVSGDQYQVEKGRKHFVEIFDPRNRILQTGEVTLSDFGSFHANLALPRAAVPGDYRIQVRDEENRTYQGSFVVHEYQLEPVRLTIDAARSVYYRGEEIEGKIKASFYYGAPLAGREVRYALANGRVFTAKTDENGEIAFKFPTREFQESQVLPLIAVLPERNLQASQNFVLASKGFSIKLETVRPIYLAGETFDLKVVVTSTEGKPLAQELKVSVLERSVVNGRVGERLVEQHDLKTDAAKGEGTLTLRLEKGGNYVLRAEGIDQFKNPVSGTHEVNISDDSDTVRLRILANRHTFKVGDTADVQIHWREEPALALITYQGAQVLQYQIVELKTGANALSIPMIAKLAPNFDLSVAVMTNAARKPEEPITKVIQRFHEAMSPFSVTRDMNVSVLVRRADGKEGTPRPGEEVQMVIKTTDPQGKPIAAELGVAMVEQSLLDLFSRREGAIGDFFHGQRRESAVRTSSSATFEYRPATQPINPRLLAEAERASLAADAEQSLQRQTENLAAMAISSSEARPMAEAASGAPMPGGMGGGGFADRTLMSKEEQADFANFDANGTTLGVPAGGSEADKKADSPAYFRGGELSDEIADARATGGRRARKAMNGRPGISGEMKAAGDSFGFDADGGDEAGLAYKQDGVFLGRAFVVPEKETLKRIAEDGQNDFVVLFESGKQTNYRFDHFWDENAEGRLLAMNQAGAMVVMIQGQQETAFWDPAVITNEQGEATITLTLPERSTSWNVLARGATVDTLTGQAETQLTVNKDLFGELKLAAAYVDGDESTVHVTVHNQAIEQQPIQVTLKMTIGGKSTEETRTIPAAAKGMHELDIPVSIRLPEAQAAGQAGADPELDAVFELTVTSANVSDRLQRIVRVRPYGLPVFTTASGSATSDTTVFLETPANVAEKSATLQVIVGSSVEKSLLDIIVGPPPFCQVQNGKLDGGLDTAVSDLMASLALQKLFGTSRSAGTSPVTALDARVRATTSMLVSSQHDDGGWGWAGKGESSRHISARVVWSLALARRSGYTVQDATMDAALNYLAGQVTQTGETDYETRAILLHALSVAGRGDFALANQLFRNRPSLSNSALSYVALALIEMDRKPMAKQLLDLLGERNLDQEAKRRTAEIGTLPWSHAAVEVRALYALGLLEVAPEAAKTKELIDWLMAHRQGYRWVPDKATGPAAMAVSQWYSKTQFKNDHYKLAIVVNNFEVQELDIDETTGTLVVPIKSEFIIPGKQRISFRISGRGQYTYQCMLGGFVAADKLANTTKDYTIERTYEPYERELDGEVIPRGFGIVQGNYSFFRNNLTQLPVGQRGRITIQPWRHNIRADLPAEQLEYLVITEPLPSGSTVIDQSVRGGFERYELSPGAITFYIGTRHFIEPISFEVYGYLPGKYRVTPTVMRDAYRPDQLVVSDTRTITVLPQGVASGDEYKLTPQEYYELGKRYFAKKDFPEAGRHLTQLLNDWQLLPDQYREVVQLLLDVHLEIGPPAAIVRYFEISKEKYPEAEITFEKILKVGMAYHELGEYERGYLVFRSTIEGSFQRESGISGFLEAKGEFLRSINVMDRLIVEYPPEGYMSAAEYMTAQRVYAYAPRAAEDLKLREKKVNRIDLIRQAYDRLDAFLADHPDDPAADQAGFSLATALLDLEQFKPAITRCEKFAELYPQSDYLDSYWYIIGYSHFALGEHEQALEMCRKVADTLLKDRVTGRDVPTRNKWQAVYILGQVYHSLGQAAEAISEYTKVANMFADAKSAIDYFIRKEITLPEVTTVKPGDAAKLELKFRNVPSCDVRVYRIDLMKFGLLKRDLAGITQINLAGIRPFHESTIELGDGKDYRDRTHEIPLPLKDEGAYLVVCRGQDLHASGLVLVTPLVVEVQEEASSGEVRATVKDSTSDKYLSKVHVKVIGTSNPDFVSGDTDLRGIFVAQGIAGTSTVIARSENDRYAFFRGKSFLGPMPQQQVHAVEMAPAGDSGNGAMGKGGDLQENIRSLNSAVQGQQIEIWNKSNYLEKKGIQNNDAY